MLNRFSRIEPWFNLFFTSDYLDYLNQFFRLSGLSPFMGDTDLETMANVTIAEYDYEDEAFNNISQEAKNFIDKLLVKEKE